MIYKDVKFYTSATKKYMYYIKQKQNIIAVLVQIVIEK